MSGTIKNIKRDFRLHYSVNYLIVLAMLLLGLVMLLTGNLQSSFARLLAQIGFSVILAVSLNLVVGFLGELSLGHAGFMCIGAYIGCFFGVHLKAAMPNKLLVLILSMIVGGLAAALFGFLIGLPSLRLKGDYLAIVTLGFGEIVRNVFKNQKIFGAAMGYDAGSLQYDTRKSPTLFIVAFLVAVIMLFLIQNLVRSKHGRAITAIRDNEIAAKAMGIGVTFYKLFAFVVSAFFAGVAGVLYGHMNRLIEQKNFSYNYSIEILVMVVLGGMGSVTGSIIAAILITCVNFFLQSRLSGDLAALRYLIYALVLIVIVIFGNAPALKNFRDSLGKVFSFRKKAPDPAVQRDDEGAWNRIPTKIKMDALLTTDLNPNEVEARPEDLADGGDKEGN